MATLVSKNEKESIELPGQAFALKNGDYLVIAETQRGIHDAIEFLEKHGVSEIYFTFESGYKFNEWEILQHSEFGSAYALRFSNDYITL